MSPRSLSCPDMWWGRSGQETRGLASVGTAELITGRFKVVASLAAVVLILAHAFFPGLSIDQITVWLFLLGLSPWLVHLVRLVRFPGGTEVHFGSQTEKEKAASVDEEIGFGRAAAATLSPAAKSPPDQVTLRSLRTSYLKTEAIALAALSEQLAPGWDLLPHQVVEFPGGYKVEADALIRGPRASRLVIVDVKLLEPSRTVSDAVSQLALVIGRTATTAQIAGQTYEPMLLWIAREWGMAHQEQILRAIASTIRETGLHVGIYDEKADRIEFAVSRPHFVRSSAPLTEL